jgi:hypothetical protein
VDTATLNGTPVFRQKTHTMNWLVFHIASGQAFFTGLALVISDFAWAVALRIQWPAEPRGDQFGGGRGSASTAWAAVEATREMRFVPILPREAAELRPVAGPVAWRAFRGGSPHDNGTNVTCSGSEANHWTSGRTSYGHDDGDLIENRSRALWRCATVLEKGAA